MPTDTWKGTDIAWLAGLLEGEGSFIVRPKNTPYISLKMNDKDIVERAANLMGTTINKKRNFYPTQVGIDTGWCVQVYDREMMSELLPKMLPYFGERRTAQVTRLMNVVSCRLMAEANYLQVIMLCEELRSRGKTYVELAELSGHSPTGVRLWCISAPTVVQISGYDWTEEGTLPCQRIRGKM